MNRFLILNCRLLIAVTSIFWFAADGVAEDVIWSFPPTTGTSVKNCVVTGPGSAPGSGQGKTIQAEYALSNVFVDSDRFDDSRPGIVNQITTWFEDDGMPFGQVDGIARLNVFVVPGPDVLPDFDDNPDFGIDVPVTYTQTSINGMKAIEVQANGLGNLRDPILIQTGVRYYIGLTPVFVKGEELFGGNHLSNFSRKDQESASAVRRTAPPPVEDWKFAEDPVSGKSLFAAIEVRGFTTPTIFLSTTGIGGGATPDHEILNLETGDSATVHIWVSENLVVDTALSLNANMITPGVAEFDFSDVFQADILAGGQPVNVRWNTIEDGMIQAGGQSIGGMSGLAFDAGTGIVPENTGPDLIDELYDPTAAAFLFGIFEVRAVSLGNTDIELSEGPFGILNSGQRPLPVFGGMTICNVVLGDVNQDGVLDLLDVAPFIQRIASGKYQAEADINKDGLVNLLDVDPFILLLSGN